MMRGRGAARREDQATRRTMAAAAGLAVLALPGGCGAGQDARDQIRVVGSSTVLPYTAAVAENFARKNPEYKSPIVEGTGTGAGIKLFCGGVGAAHADIADASRRITRGEFAACRTNGVDRIVELQIGIDGLTLAQALGAPALALTPRDVYAALAAEPFGRPQRARTWADVNPALPPTPIAVYGPPPTSGTRDAFADLMLTKGCETDPAMVALKKSDPDRARSLCTRVREDGGYREAGENDNLIVQKLAANPDAVGIFGYDFLAENRDRIRGIPIGGVAPTDGAIASFRYPGSRPLFIYVKSAHLVAIPGLRAFVEEYARAWHPDGYLARRGLIPSPAADRAHAAAVARTLPSLDPATLD